MMKGAGQYPAFETAEDEDVAALVCIEEGSAGPWTAEAFRAELHRNPEALFVLRSSGRAVAFLVARIHVPDMDIVNLAVASDQRRRGLGGHLLRQALDRAFSEGVRRAFLEVREGNRAARALYEALGFRETQRRPAFYRDPVEDAILMSLEIDQAAVGIDRQTALVSPNAPSS